ncbi:MAG: preprotein translocase subunit SecG [Rhodobacteraceae bacterium]|nr:preprotein translocase subunit SecG [Paracoccaceae bacterium]
MSNVTLVVHLILALVLIGIVLIQRSEGGGLGIGGGGNLMTGRQAATALGKLTWVFAIAFLATSITLTILSARNLSSDSVLERLGGPLTESVPEEPLSLGTDLLVPQATDEPALPPKAE